MTVQSLKLAEQLIKTRIKRTNKRDLKSLSLSSVFHELRANENLAFFGDYPLLAIAVEEIKKVFEISRWAISSAMRKSEELSQLSKKEKTELVNILFGVTGATEN